MDSHSPESQSNIVETFSDEDNQSYIAFIKAFAPVLLHLVEQDTDHRREDIKHIIAEFQAFSEDEVPDADKTTALRNWVDLQSDAIGELTPAQIKEIMEAAKLQKLVLSSGIPRVCDVAQIRSYVSTNVGGFWYPQSL
jgi:hypothetical protein